MEKSANYNFNLPNSANDEIADINDISDNFRIIDEIMNVTDQTYNPTSENAQSGIAVAEAVGEVKNDLANIKDGFGDGILKLKRIGKNIFNKSAAHEDGKLIFEDGEIYDNSNWVLYDYIKVKSNTTYCFRYGWRICFYDENKTFLYGVNGTETNPYVITTPDNCAYIRFSVLATYIDIMQIEEGDSYTGFEEFTEILNVDNSGNKYNFDNIVLPIVTPLIDRIPTINYDAFNLAYVKNGRVVCNDTIHPSEHNNTAKYIGVDCGGDFVSSAEIRFGFTGDVDDSCSIMLISTSLGCEKTADIVSGSCHFGVSPFSASIEYFDESTNITRTYTHTFETPLENDTDYTFKWIIQGDYSQGTGWLSVKYPDGATEIVTDSQFPLRNGKYLIFEHFYSNNSNRRGYYTGWKAISKDSDGNLRYLRHDFKHQANDGMLNTAPTGQNYILFSNDVWGATQMDYE